MSTGNFQQTSRSLPPPSSTSISRTTTPGTTSSTPKSQLDNQGINEDIKNLPPISSNQYNVMLPPHSQAQQGSLPQNILSGADYSFHVPYSSSRHPNLYLFSSDCTTVTSPSSLEEKERDKGAPNLVVSSRIFNNANISHQTNIGPKPYVTLHISDSKNDKMISGFDRQVDGLSPLSVIAVSNFHEHGQSSPNLTTSGLTQSQQALRYQAGSDAMLSAINYNENDMLPEGEFDVPVTSAFGTLDGLLGSIGGGGVSASSMRLPDLLEGDGSQEPYIDTGQDLQLSPESFTTGTEGFSVDSSSMNRISTNSSSTECTEENRKTPEAGNVALAEKLRAKSRPVKATSPSRPGTQPCPTCGKVFSNSSALTKHKLTHSDERKYICQLCTKAFKRQDHLNGHMLTHRNKKPYECDVEGCAKSYCDARSLRRHKENHHSNTCSTGNVNIPSVGSHMNVIPAMTHLGFASLQSSFPASVITSSSDQIFSDGTENCNRIQYAPAIGTANQSISHNEFNQESASKSAERQILNSVVPTAASKLQFLALHQQPQQFHQQNKGKTTQAPSARTEKHTVLAPWHPQTINTNALLLAQNFGSLGTSQSSISHSQTGQIDISKTLDTISNIKNRTSPNNLAQHLETQASEDLKKEPHSHESQKQTLQSSDSDSYLSSPVGPTTSHSSTEVPVSFSHSQLSSDHGLDIDTNANSTDNMFGQHPVSLNASLQQTEVSGSTNTNVDVNVTTSISNIVAISESDQPQINSPLLQQLLTPPQRMDVLSNSTTEGALAQRAALLQQALLAGTQQQSLHQQSIFPNWNQVAISFTNANCNNSRFGADPKPVACSICKRKFKNIPALNGHMRLHGGYFKKENDLKKTDRKQLVTSQQPLQTASTNVRALIEEKIIRKITTSQASSQLSLDTLPLGGSFYSQTDPPNIEKTATVSSAQFLSNNMQNSALNTSQENTLCNDFPPTSQNSTLYDNISKINNELMAALDWQKEINELKEQFRVPQPPGEKLRRHSDSDHFIPSKRQCPSYTKSALADLLKKKVAKRTSRTGSDPGEPLLHIESSQTSLASPAPSASAHNPPDLTPHIPFSTGHPLSLVSNQNLSSLNVEDSDLPSLLEQELIKSSESDVCLAMSSSVFSTVNQALSTTVCPIANGDELDKRDELSSTATDSSQWSTNLALQFFGNESQPQYNTVLPSLPPSSTASGSTINCARNKTGEDSNDDDVFLSPVSLPTSPLKIKRKHRPEPLFIPPYVNNCGFTSRLRSPRLWDPSNPDNKNASPPPYTPPPMLSPVRSGSGLFWHILSGSGSLTPKSAPITPSFSLIRRNSTSEVSPEEEEICEAPETDIQPHVNIGTNFQARLPPFNPNRHEALRCEEKADIVWDPKIAENLSENDVEMYLDLSCSAVVPGGGKNKEYAMHILHLAGGNIQEAMLRLMDPNPMLPVGHPLLTYKYPETDKWTPEDIESYHQSLIRCDKDFYSISQEMQMKTVKQCVQFYYIWKKVCPEEYKRLRLIRRRREQESLIYGSRPQLPSDCDEKMEAVHDGLNCDMQFPDINMPTANGSIPTSEQNPAQNTIDTTRTSANRTINGSSFLPIVRSCDMSLDPPEEFPCKICGKVFSKVKSRSAHMKSHKQTESEKKNKFDC